MSVSHYRIQATDVLNLCLNMYGVCFSKYFFFSYVKLAYHNHVTIHVHACTKPLLVVC